MSFGVAKQAISLLIFNATNWSKWADNTATTPNANVVAALHTADPTSGNQTTSEAAYTSYARVSVVRTSSGWSCSSGVTTNVGTIAFPACTGGSSTVTNVSLGRDTSGVGEVVVAGALTASLAVSNGITPQFAASALSITLA
jgi:hypothetical protein